MPMIGRLWRVETECEMPLFLRGSDPSLRLVKTSWFEAEKEAMAFIKKEEERGFKCVSLSEWTRELEHNLVTKEARYLEARDFE